MIPIRRSAAAALAACVLVLCLRAAAEEAPAPTPAWRARLEKASASPDAWAARRVEIRQRILVATGLWPEFDRAPLKPVIFGKIERDGYSIEKVHFETWPGFHLTGNLYRPLGKTGPFPAVLCPHGHWKNGRFEDSPDASVPGRSLTLARLGFVVFTYDMVGYGDSKPLTHEFGDPAWGISLCGLQLWNGIRAVDFVSSLPDVDPKRIGCTGASGGGTQTFLLTAVDDRVQCAAPVNMVAAEFQGGCPCENAPLLRIDLNNVEIAAATAPRPLLMISTTGDWTKTNPQDVDSALAAIYERLGVKERFRGVQFDYGHNYNKDSREAMYAWFVHWLRDGKIPNPNSQIPTKSQTPNPNAGATSPEPRTPNPEPPMRIPEPPFTIEKREDLAVWGPDHPLPEGAADRAALEETIRSVIRAQLEALRPRDAAGLARFRELMEAALRDTLLIRWPRPADVDHIPDEKTERFSRIRQHGLVGEALVTRGGRGSRHTFVFSTADLSVTPPSPMWFNSADFTISIGVPVEVPPFGRPEEHKRFVTTYLRTPLAWRTQEATTALAWFHMTTSPSQFGAPDRQDIVGLDVTGVPAFLAAALIFPRTVVIDMAGYDEASPSSWSADLAHPGLLRVGGLRTAGCLIAAKGGRLVLHNTQGKFVAAWVRDAFKAAGREQDLIVDEKAWSAEQILEALKK
jgi:dienelactone hydrolase